MDFNFFIALVLVSLTLLFLFEIDTIFVLIAFLVSFSYVFWQGAKKVRSKKK